MQKIINKVIFFWGKTDRCEDGLWNPLLLHLIDVAASADAILSREPLSSCERMAAMFGLTWDQALPWIQFLIACHDMGKACPGFQNKWQGASKYLKEMGLNIPIGVNSTVHHGFVSQIALCQFLVAREWPQKLAEKVADAVGCHHGERIAPIKLSDLEGDRKSLGDIAWAKSREAICEQLFDLFQPKDIPVKETLSGPEFMLLAGLTSFADWIGSNAEWFAFGTLQDAQDLNGWWQARKAVAQSALDSIGWEVRKPLSHQEASFEQVFKQTPRPLQEAVATAVKEISEPSILLIEAPMGEGKTEAAFYAHLELQRTMGHRGLYIALPSKATGNAMFKRTLAFLRSQGSERMLDLQLLHGSTAQNDEFQELRLVSIGDEGSKGNSEGSVRAGEWFTRKKRALLSEYGVGTVDQALMCILPVRHQFVRLWGLANRTVVFDEIHAYDAYTGTLLQHLLQWLIALDSSVILLSATLPPVIKQKLAKIVGCELPSHDVPYPRLSIFRKGKIEQIAFLADPSRHQTLKIEKVSPKLEELKYEMERKLENGGLGLIIVNTVQRAQELYQLFPEGEPMMRAGVIVGKRLSDEKGIFLFHARYPADKRQQREDAILSVFGKEGVRNGTKILIATQVVEQSLDLDFDCIVTDLAPIDLLLQRAGRLWRHKRSMRATVEPVLVIAGLDDEEPPHFGKPLWWKSVYREDILLRTWCLLRSRTTLKLPDDIDDLVQSVYEERVEIPDFLNERLEKALCDGEGKAMASTGQAHQAIIGFPNDRSWDDPSRYIQVDEDELGLLHSTLRAQTRLGEPSVTVIPISADEASLLKNAPDHLLAKAWLSRAVSLSRKNVVSKLQTIGVHEPWKKSTHLRNCYPFTMDARGCWQEDLSVRLDEELGIVYQFKGEA